MSSGKVKCTCGWSWNKSDSSKKDMYICHECGRDNSNNMKNGGWLDSYANGGTMQEHQENYNDSSVSLPEGFVGMGNNTKGRNYSPAWGGQFQMGGSVYPVNYFPEAQGGMSIPGAGGHLYARYEQGGDIDFSYPRTKGIPSNGPYAKKTMASAKDGGWLDQYEKAQDGDLLDKWRADHPTVRSFINDTQNRKIQAYKGKGKETNIIQKDNVKTVTPKIGKIATAKEKEQRAIEQNKLAQQQSEQQAAKDWVQGSMEEAYKSPLMSPGYFTPEGVAIGALQGATKLGPDLYEGNYKGAAMDALMALPIGVPAAKTLLSRFTPKQNYTLPEPPLELNLDVNSLRLNLERTVPKAKKAIRDYGKVDIGNDLTLYNNPSGLTDPSSVLGRKMAVKSVRDNVSGKSIELKTFKDSNGELKYYMSADLPNRIKAGRAFLELDKHIPIGAKIQEPGSLSFDSLLNVAKQSQSPKFASSVEGTIQLNDNAFFNKIKNSGDSALGKEYYTSLENANKGVEEVNALLKKYNLPNAEAKQVVRNDGSLSKIYSMHVPNVTLKKLYSILGISTIGAASQLEQKREGGIIKDDMGQYNHPGEITEIGSNQITMQGVPYPVLGISDTGDTQMMYPEEEYEFDGEKVTEYPMAKNGLRQEQKGLVNLDQLTNFTNYNKPQPGGWLNKYN